jgi:hypothetical protein
MADFGKEALGILGEVAPVIATALGGPLAGAAVRAIGSALGLSADATPAAVSAAVTVAPPDHLLALKQADQAFSAQMKQLDIDLTQADNSERANARAREISVKDVTPSILAYVLTLGFFGLLALMVFHDVPAANDAAVNILLGALGTGWIQSMAYYFGSSAGSRTKDAMLFQSTPATRTPTVTGETDVAR